VTKWQMVARLIGVLRLVGVLATFLAAPGHAQGEVAPFFPPTVTLPPEMRLNGAAQFHDGKLRLTPSLPNQRGAAWAKNKIWVADGFTYRFKFQITNRDAVYGGADGFAFVIQNADLLALGDDSLGGSGLGYNGIPNSVAIEFDTWRSTDLGDPNGNHISVHSAGTGLNSADERYSWARNTVPLPDLKDGAVHSVTIDYKPPFLRTFMDEIRDPVVTVEIDLSQVLLLDGKRAWVGFTASTGVGAETHDLLRWF
jgi:hypothetical protein